MRNAALVLCIVMNLISMETPASLKRDVHVKERKRFIGATSCVSVTPEPAPHLNTAIKNLVVETAKLGKKNSDDLMRCLFRGVDVNSLSLSV